MKIGKLFFISCLQLCNLLVLGQYSISDEVEYPLKKKFFSCQHSPEKVYSETTYIYNDDRKLTELIIIHGINEGDTTFYYFKYSPKGYLLSEKNTYSNSEVGVIRAEGVTKYFEYDSNGQLVSCRYENNGYSSNTSIKYNEYGVVLEKYEKHGSNEYLFTYNYDNKRNLEKEYRNGDLYYKYKYNKNNILVKKIRYNYSVFEYQRFFYAFTHFRHRPRVNRKQITNYIYNEDGKIKEIIESGIIIEKRIYNNGKLDEKMVIDLNQSSSRPCGSAYILRYEYF